MDGVEMFVVRSGFGKVGDAEDGEIVLVGDDFEGFEMAPDDSGVGTVFEAEECGEGIENEEAGVADFGESEEEPFGEGCGFSALFDALAEVAVFGGDHGERRIGTREEVAVGIGGGEAEVESVQGVFPGEDDGGGGHVVFGIGIFGRGRERVHADLVGMGRRGGIFGETGGEVDGEEGFADAGVAEEEGEVTWGEELRGEGRDGGSGQWSAVSGQRVGGFGC